MSIRRVMSELAMLDRHEEEVSMRVAFWERKRGRGSMDVEVEREEATDEDPHVGNGDTDATDHSLPGYGSVQELYGVQRKIIVTWAS